MRIAIISDVHGNLTAFDAVLADLAGAGIDRLVCLGDMLQGGAQPAETVARLRELGCSVVIGNADAWLLSGRVTNPHEAISEQQLAVREWSLTRLSEADRRFISGFQPTVEVELGDGRQLLACHGSPASWDEIIYPETDDAEVQRMLGPHLPRLICGGHTHLQQYRRLGDAFFFNPGSTGFAYMRNQPKASFRADPWAEYAVLSVSGGRLALEFRRVPFDAAALIEVYKASGRPYADVAVAQYQ